MPAAQSVGMIRRQTLIRPIVFITFSQSNASSSGFATLPSREKREGGEGLDQTACSSCVLCGSRTVFNALPQAMT